MDTKRIDGIFMVLVLLLLPATMSAQTLESGSIAEVVRDTTGAVLAHRIALGKPMYLNKLAITKNISC
jgi:hypothetical protein